MKQTTHQIPHASALAFSFIQELNKCLTRSETSAIVLLNKREKDQSICHTHDFCDANIVMEAAWISLGAPEMDLQNDRHTACWSEAWSIAKVRFAQELRGTAK